jgi:hypothetical protein
VLNTAVEATYATVGLRRFRSGSALHAVGIISTKRRSLVRRLYEFLYRGSFGAVLRLARVFKICGLFHAFRFLFCIYDVLNSKSHQTSSCFVSVSSCVGHFRSFHWVQIFATFKRMIFERGALNACSFEKLKASRIFGVDVKVADSDSANYGSADKRCSHAIRPIKLHKRKASDLGDHDVSLDHFVFPGGGLHVMGSSSPQIKKRRTMSRCSKSFRRLTELSVGLFSEDPLSDEGNACEDVPDSPYYADPLFCLGGEDSNGIAQSTLTASSSTLFPCLPTTVSEASYSTKASVNSTRTTNCANSVLDASSCDAANTSNVDNLVNNTNSKSYGWFIALDDGEDARADARCSAALTLYSSGSCENSTLAFVAPTAPKGASIEEEAQVAWAQAADTVDDIFGGLDF